MWTTSKWLELGLDPVCTLYLRSPTGSITESGVDSWVWTTSNLYGSHARRMEPVHGWLAFGSSSANCTHWLACKPRCWKDWFLDPSPVTNGLCMYKAYICMFSMHVCIQTLYASSTLHSLKSTSCFIGIYQITELCTMDSCLLGCPENDPLFRSKHKRWSVIWASIALLYSRTLTSVTSPS